jgi:purine-binding chemotaxis protein CheW
VNLANPAVPRRAVDWAGLRERVATTAATTPEPRAVLEARARELARPPHAPRAETAEAVTFAVAGEWYAADARCVVEVFRPGRIARVPGAEPAVAGVTGWRGELLTVLDLAVLLGLPPLAPAAPRMVVVLDAGGPPCGVVVDAVGELARIDPGELRALPETARRTAHLLGITRDAVLVLDAAGLIGAQG